MNIENLQRLNDYKEVQDIFRVYLQTRYKNPQTYNTYLSDFAYLWRYLDKESFWFVATSYNFDEIVLDYLRMAVLRAPQRVKINLRDNNEVTARAERYIPSLKRFREFLWAYAAEGEEHKEDSTKEPVKTQKEIPFENSHTIPRPTPALVQKYLEQWDANTSFVKQDQALDELFHKTYPDNKYLHGIIVKAGALNSFYGTNLREFYPLAKHIQTLDIDKRLAQGDLSLVASINDKNVLGMRVYSFATKYCSFCKPDVYPIYDSFVAGVLCHFRDKHHFEIFKDNDLLNYPRFKEIILSFIEYYNLEKFTIKQIDQFIWQFGKDYELKKYIND